MFWQKRTADALPPRAVLVTFDDAYASVAELAAPLCQEFGLPAVFFVNAAFLDNQRLAPDNLVCYVANVLGMETINAAARSVRDAESLELHSITEVFASFLPSLTLTESGKYSMRSCDAWEEFQRASSGQGNGSVLDHETTLRSRVFRFRDWEPYLQPCALQVSVA